VRAGIGFIQKNYWICSPGGFIVYREMNATVAPSEFGWIEYNLSIWNICSSAVGAIVGPFLDIRRACGIPTAQFGEGYVARE
jgi:hypothetical protein